MSQLRKYGRKAAGFTLVELLVVIGIIAVLISILLPALSRARAAAITVACASNMRQIGQAMFMYTQDNQGYLPYGYLKGYYNGNFSANDYQITWDDLISPYLGKNYVDWQNNPWGAGWAGYNLKNMTPLDVLYCAADSIPINETLTGADPQSRGYFKRSYAVPVADCDGTGSGSDGSPLSWTMFATWNATAANWPPPKTSFRSFKLTEAKDTAGTFLLVEKPGDYNIQGTTNNVYCQYSMQQYCNGNGGGEKPITLNGTHNGKWNYLYCDGHVENLAASETWGHNPTTHAAGYERWWSYGPWTRRTDDN